MLYRRAVWAAAGLGVLTVVVSVPAAVRAGIVNSPLPQFSDGKTSVTVLAVPGVVKRNRLQTDFLCTSFDSGPVDIGVEVFGPDGSLLNDVHAGNGAVLNVAPNRTVTLGTSGTATYLESAVITLPSVSQGSARVVASSANVTCNAVVLDDAVSPPVSITPLGAGLRPVAGPVLPAAPLPTFADSQPAAFAVLVPGVIKRHTLNTTFLCTSLAPANIDVGVEVFAPDGTRQNDIHAGNGAVLNVAPGATVTLSTTGTAAFLESTVIGSALVSQGFGRIVSTSAQVACAVLALDAGTSPPVTLLNLPDGVSASLGDVNRDGVVSAADVPAVIRQIFP